MKKIRKVDLMEHNAVLISQTEPIFVMKKLKSIQQIIDYKKYKSKKAKNLIYDFLKEENKYCKNRNFTSQFLCDMQNRTETIEVFKGEKGEKIFTFSFNE
jgi:hypothetical protein